MKYEIVELEEKVVAGIKIRTCDFEEYQNNSKDMQKQEIHIYIAIED